MENGWDESAGAWIAEQGEYGDFGRAGVMDRPMLARVRASGARNALDVGCGEGRFCRMLQQEGLTTIGIDPTVPLLDAARARDPQGDYREARAEDLPFDDARFDLVISYFTLIDIDDMHAAIAEMARVLKPGGHLLIANLNNFNTAADPDTREKLPGGAVRITIDNYLEPRADWVTWAGIRIRNHHRPLAHYMQALLAQGLILRHFDEPRASGPDAERNARYDRFPYHMMMDWQKPGP